MHLKKLEIFGFKSFADKTVLNFEPGIAAIVGPNGCGKSNIFDSIRWVLGEQSVKDLRGSSMEDVIFNGTDKRPALGFAEVSLTFSNESRMLPVDYNEVSVTRRLFRSGESEYLLNKTTVRLKDILELFMGTGMGAEAYSLVQQGKVDLVVSAKPEDRRLILDEAAGITKYKSKRKEALSKLRETETNLLRCNDIVLEVKRQISSLERQASKARRYKEEFEKLKVLEVKLANTELSRLAEQRLEIEKRLEELRSQEARLTQEIQSLNERFTAENDLLEELEEKVNQVQAQQIKLDGQIDIQNRQIAFHEERWENIGVQQNRLKENQVQLAERSRIQQEKIAEIKQTISSLDDSIQKREQVLQEKRRALSFAIDSIKAANQEIHTEEEKILGITSKQVQVKNKLTEIMKEVQGSIARKSRLEKDNTKINGEKSEVEDKFRDISGKIQASDQKLRQLKEELDVHKQNLNERTAQLNALEQTIDDLDKKALFLESQKEFLEKLGVQYQDMPDPIVQGRLLTSIPPSDRHTGIIGKVKGVSVIDPDKQELLRSNVPSEMPLPTHEIICEAKFIELDPQQISQKVRDVRQEIVSKTSEKEQVFLLVEEQRTQVEQIQLNIQDEEKNFSIQEAQKKNIMEASDKLCEELEVVQTELEQASGYLTSIKVQEEDFLRQLDALNQELSASQISIKEKQTWIAGKAQEREVGMVAIAQVEAEITSLNDKKVNHTQNVPILEESLLGYMREIQRFEDEHTEFEKKKIQLQEEIEELRGTIVQIQDHKNSLDTTRAGYARQKEEILQKLNGIRADIMACSSEVETIKDDLHRQQLDEQQVAFKEKEVRDRLSQTYKIDLEAFNRQAPPAIPSAPEQTEKTETVEGVAQKAPDVPVAEYATHEELLTAIERLRKRCDAFGAVNLIAIEEFEQLRERYEFLTKQQSDLITAKESLHQTILHINRQSKQMFVETFSKVSEEFRIYYRMLFGGGDAQLVLLDPENVLESGIEIIARPPGKKLQSISLLSGGEKSLTAIALIFGVFKVNPSPFCVLDEIDAALDESNVGRFSYLVRDFAKIAQFIIITHNKKTISSVDVMYGITMEETGVSKIVSVKFGGQEKQEAKAEQSQEVSAGV